MNTYTIFKLDIAKKLIKCGYRCIDVKPNRDKPWLNVYKFENTEELREAVRVLTAKNQN